MTDPHRRAVTHLRRADPTLATIINAVGPCTLVPRVEGTHFASLVRSIVFQQLSGKAAGTIHGRVEALFENGVVSPAALLALDDTVLRNAGLSRQKIAYVRDLATHVERGTLDLGHVEAHDDETIITQLTHVHGVGRWSAEMFLMFRLGRPDVLPVGDLGIRKAVMLAWGLDAMPSPKQLTAIATKWSPWRTVACWYLWRSLDNGGGQL